MGDNKRPIPFSIEITEEDEELMQTSRATYEVMKKVNLKLRKYAKDNRGVSDTSDLFDLTPLIDQIKDYPIFVNSKPTRSMSTALIVVFDYLNSLFHELHYFGIVKIRSSYDDYLSYRINLAKKDKIMVLNDTGYTYDSFRAKMVPQKRIRTTDKLQNYDID